MRQTQIVRHRRCSRGDGDGPDTEFYDPIIRKARKMDFVHAKHSSQQRKVRPMSATKIKTRTVPFATDDSSRCAFKTDKGRQCKLVVHTNNEKHVFVNRDSTREHVPLSKVVPAGFSLTATEVRKTDVLKKQVGSRGDTKPRDADQRKVDGHVQKSAGKNANHTTKTEFDNLSVSQYVVPPPAVDTVLDYLRRATNSGGPEAARGMQLRYRKADHPSGNVTIQWAVVKKAAE